MVRQFAIWHLLIIVLLAALISDVIANPALIDQARRFPGALAAVLQDVFIDGPERERVFIHNSHLGERKTPCCR